MIADIDTYDASARALAAGAQAVVVSVEYRHAPEAPFSAAHEDANIIFGTVIDDALGDERDPGEIVREAGCGAAIFGEVHHGDALLQTDR